MRDSGTPVGVRRTQIICVVGALVCAAVFLISMVAASTQADRARAAADAHGLTVCHPNTICHPPARGDVACAGAPNEECRLSNGSILMAGDIDYAQDRPTGWKMLYLFSAVIGGGFLVVLGMMTNARRRVRQHESIERRRIDKAIRVAEAQTASARAAEAKARSDG